MRIPVICMDQSVRTICTDSGTTAAEICKAMAAKTNLDDDAFGFALFLALDNKVSLRKVTESGFDSHTGNSSLCPWERDFMLISHWGLTVCRCSGLA